MDKGDEEPAGERFGGAAPPGEEAILRYEEHITGLLVTIAHLHGQIESLQRSQAREDDDLCSDLCSEYTASLPRCSLPFPNPEAALPPPARQPERGNLFLDVHKAVASLENTVFAHRSRLPSANAKLEGRMEPTQEALGDLNTRLHLTEKEKQRLALQMYTFRAQEAACLLIAQILQGERDELHGQQTVSTGSSSSSSGEDSSEDFPLICTSQSNAPRPSEDAGVEQPTEEANREASKFLDTLTHVNGRIEELKERISSLLAELEERSQDSRAQEAQQMALTRDFFKAHSALVLAYQNGRKKQEAQLHQLETQIGLMGQRQAGQLQSLVRTLRRLEGRAGSPDSA